MCEQPRPRVLGGIPGEAGTVGWLRLFPHLGVRGWTLALLKDLFFPFYCHPTGQTGTHLHVIWFTKVQKPHVYRDGGRKREMNL